MKFCPKCHRPLEKVHRNYFMCYHCIKGWTPEELQQLKGFDLETAINIFLAYKDWDFSDDLQYFLEFVKEQGMKIREGID